MLDTIADRLAQQVADNRWGFDAANVAEYQPRHDADDFVDVPESYPIGRQVGARVELSRRPYLGHGLDGATAHLQLRARHAAEPDEHWTLEDQALAHAHRMADARRG